MPREWRAHCPNCGSQLWKIPKDREKIPVDAPLECAKCGKTSDKKILHAHNEKAQYEEPIGVGDIAVQPVEDRKWEMLFEEMKLRKQRLQVLKKLIKIQGLIPLTDDESSSILAGAPVDFVKCQVYKHKVPDGQVLSWG